MSTPTLEPEEDDLTPNPGLSALAERKLNPARALSPAGKERLQQAVDHIQQLTNGTQSTDTPKKSTLG